MRNIPNLLTFLRLVLIPLFVILMILDLFEIAFVVFVIAAITDYFDGLIARKFGYITDFGKLLDPLADKILVMTALVMLVAEQDQVTGNPWVPAWLVALIIAREIWVTGLRGVAASSGKVIAAKGAGKLKSFLQMLAISMLLLNQVILFSLSGYNFTAGYIGIRLLFLSVFFSLWGAVDYTKIVFSESQKN